MEELYCFEVDTTYKSGRKKNEIIVSSSEDKMWEHYDKHHNNALIESCAVVDSWIL